jgi:Sulfotransferase domain
VKVLGVGLSSTGTTSLHRALAVLGFKGIDYPIERLRDVIDGSNPGPDFHRFDDVDAVTDLPASYFYDELRQVYPMCKCILTIRNEDDWWESIRQYTAFYPIEKKSLQWQLANYVYGSAKTHEFLWKKKYREHNERVLAKIPGDRLLVMHITAGDGWEKLCPFLGVAIPAVPFPRENTRKDRERRRRLVHSDNRAAADIADLVAAGGAFVLVDGRWLAPEALPERRAIPFLERDGQYWGPPADDATAIRELERLRRAGAGHIVFAWPAFWWLEHYAGFHRHLRSRFRCALENERLVVFDLRSE